MAKKVDNDKVILDLKKEVEEKKKLLKESQKFSPKTNCLITLDGERYNLNVIDKNTTLLLIAKINSLNTALHAILPSEIMSICGFTVDIWLKDLTSKFNYLNRKAEEERLSNLEKKLHNLLSNDKKVELELADLKSQI